MTRARGNDGTTAASKTKRGPAVPHLSVAERIARGKAARNEVPRSGHAVFEPLSTRPDPVELLERQAKTRVPELVPIRYGRMLVSPFTFYRGTAAIMANDLGATPGSGLTVQCSAMPTCRTLVCSPRRSDGWYSMRGRGSTCSQPRIE